MVRLGLIGAGRWGRNYVRTIAGLEGASLTRLASRNPDSPALAGPQCAVSADWRDLVSSGDLDGLIVASPPALHAEMALSAVDAGIPVLVEKPFTLDLRSAAAVRDLARSRGVVVMVEHTHLFHPAFQELKRRAPALGAPRAIDAEAGNEGPYREDTTVLWDWGSHDVAMCLDLLREPPRAVSVARLARERRGSTFGETLEIGLTFAGGLPARIRLSNLITERKRRFTLACGQGLLVYDDLAANKLVAEQGGLAEPIAVSPELPLRRAVAAFVAAIAAGTDPSAGADLAVDVVEVLERCESALARQ